MTRDVVVIGAGVSGLSAAYDLVRRGRDVVVLERQVVIGGNLLPHDHNLVPLGAITIAYSQIQAGGGINKGVAIAPDEVNFAQLGHQRFIRRITLQSAIDQIRRLIIQPVGHVEISLGDGVRLVQIDSRFTAKRVFERTERP